MNASATPTEADIADLLDAVAEANTRIAAQAARITAWRAAVGHAAVDRLSRLADPARPGAAARAQLCRLDPKLLLAGTSLWLKRHCHQQTRAGVRARQRWGGRTP